MTLPHQSARRLIPLQRVYISGYTPSTDELDDIAFAFSDTLHTIDLTAPIRVGNTEAIRIGRGWVDLPRLTRIRLDGRRLRLEIDQLLLAHCPNVTDVKFKDGTQTYRCQDIVPSSPSHLGRLEELRLDGWTTLTFHPETLQSTAQLRKLRLSAAIIQTDRVFIPPVEELSRSYGEQDALSDRVDV